MTPERWRYTCGYLREVFGAEDPLLAELTREAAAAALPEIAVSADVAASLATLIQPPASGLRSIFARRRITHRPIDLEYRVCPTASVKDARSEEERLNGLRRAYLQRRKASGWA